MRNRAAMMSLRLAAAVVLPYLIFLATMFNTVLLAMGYRYVYGVLILASVGLMLCGRLRVSALRGQLVLTLYIWVAIAAGIVQSVVFGGGAAYFLRALAYVGIPIYWMLYFAAYGHTHFPILLRWSIPVVFVVAALGVLQFFVSPNLFGLIETESLAQQWAASTTLDVYSGYFRASSTLGSPQVYALFIALGVVLVTYQRRGLWQMIGVVGLGLAGLLSASKSVLVLLALYAVVRMTERDGGVFAHARRVAIVVVPAWILIFGLISFSDDLPVLQRLTSLSGIVERELHGARVDRYQRILANDNFLMGNGFGSIEAGHDPALRASESYVLQLYYEGGIFVVSMFVAFLTVAYVRALQAGTRVARDTILLSAVAMMFVHAYASPVFFLFWGLLIAPLSREGALGIAGRRLAWSGELPTRYAHGSLDALHLPTTHRA